jgi:hypothetical protein
LRPRPWRPRLARPSRRSLPWGVRSSALPRAFLLASLLPNGFLRGSGARNFIGYFHYGPHRLNVVNPDDVRAIQHRDRNCRGGSEFSFKRCFPRQKMFARRAHHYRQIQNGELIQASQDLRVLLLALPEPEAWIDHDALAFQAFPHGAMHRGVQFHRQVCHRIFQGRKLGPRLRRPAHVVQDESAIGLNHRAREFRIGCQPRRVVDDIRAQFQRLRRDSGFIGIHGKRDREPALQTFQHRNQPSELFGLTDARGTRTHGFRADIDDVRALFLQFHGACEGAVWIAIFPAVGKRIRRDVENSHHQRAFAQLQGLVSKFPFVMLAGHLRDLSERIFESISRNQYRALRSRAIHSSEHAPRCALLQRSLYWRKACTMAAGSPAFLDKLGIKCPL